MIDNAREFTQQYEGVRRRRVEDTRVVLARALETGVGVHIVCRSREESEQAKAKYNERAVIGSVIDDTPLGSLRIKYADLVHDSNLE